MSRRYEYQDAARAAVVLKAMLPEGIAVTATLTRDGWEMSIAVCGSSECKSFEFGPGITDHHLVTLAESWATGDYVAPAEPATHGLSALQSQSVETAEQLISWARNAKHGARAIYFRGELAQFRYDGPRQLREKSAMLEKINVKNKKDPDVARLRVQVNQLQTTLELLVAVERLREASVIVLMQLRLTDGSGCVYFAVKR